MSDEEAQDPWMEALATLRTAWFDLVRIGVVQFEADQGLDGLKETVDGMTEEQAKAVLTVSAGLAAIENMERRRAAESN